MRSPIGGCTFGIAYRHRKRRARLCSKSPPKQDPTKQDPRSSRRRRPAPTATYRPPLKPALRPPRALRPPCTTHPVSLGLSTHNFTHGPRAFPTLIAPYKPIRIDQPDLVNAPRIDQLIHDGKLQITLQDAVELALENSLDIAVQRYYPWIADTDILRTEAGAQGRGVPGADFASSSALINPFSFAIISYIP